jgi:hypothetical protein
MAKQDTKDDFQKFSFATKGGETGWTWLHKADDRFATGGTAPTYSVELFLPPDSMVTILGDKKERVTLKTFEGMLNELHDGAVEAARAKATGKAKTRITDMDRPWGFVGRDDLLDREGKFDERMAHLVGCFRIRPKMKAFFIDKKTNEQRDMKPVCFDADNKEVKKIPPLGRGSIICVNANAAQYLQGTNAGATIYLAGIKILKAKIGAGRSAEQCGFDDDDEGDFKANAFEDEVIDDDDEGEDNEIPMED